MNSGGVLENIDGVAYCRDHLIFDYRLWSSLQATGLLLCLVWYYYLSKFFSGIHILPPYVLFFKLNFVISVITLGLLIAVPSLPLTAKSLGKANIFESLLVGLIWGTWHLFIDGVAIMLLQKGIGVKSYLAGIRTTMLFSIVTTVCIAVARRSAPNSLFKVAPVILFNIFMVSFYGFIAFAPSPWLFRRTAIYIYARFWVFLRFGGLIGGLMDLSNNPLSPCVNFIFETVVFTIFQPLILYQTFAKDSSYWRGDDVLRAVYQSRHYRSVRRQTTLAKEGTLRSKSFETSSALHSPLLGIQIDSASTGVILEQVDTFVNQQFLIDFRDLALQESCVVGVGGSARVYKGKYRDENVAVKLLYCIEITRKVIDDFFTESKVLMQLSHSHPNIIKIKGVCVAPPALGIVLELCNESLFKNLRRSPKTSFSRFIRLAIDCTRALKYLHSRQPPLCHRDVKSLNFLLKDGVVKLADMGLTRRKNAGVATQKGQKYGSIRNGQLKDSEVVAGTVQWAAPEVLKKEEYTEKSDIYSLGVVLWEILTGELPYDNIKFETQIEKHVLSGGRLRIPQGTHPTIAKLIKKMWEEKPQDRISANEIMKTLKHCLQSVEDVLEVKKFDIIEAIADPLNKLRSNRFFYGTMYRDCFVGKAVLDYLLEDGLIETRAEGISILNILLKKDHLIKHVTNDHDFKDELLFYCLTDMRSAII